MYPTTLDIGDVPAATKPTARRRRWAGALLVGRGRAVCVVIGVVTLVWLLVPSGAQAISLNPLEWIKSGIGGVTGGLGSLGANLAVKGFVAILNSLFSGFEARITLHVLTWLTSSANQTGGHIAPLYGLTSGIALGLLGAVLTASFLRYWLAGLSLSGRGGFEAVEGLMRTLAAVAGLLVWPFLFNQLVALGNLASATILRSPSLRGDIAHIINTVVFVTFRPSGPIGLFISIVLAVAGALLFLGLLFMKVLTGAALTFLYVAMPIAIILWPVDELAWLARHAARTFFALILIPVVWALIFATFAAISVNALEFQGAHGFINQVTQPLVAIAMLWLTITIPRTLFRLATSGIGLGRHGGGFIANAGGYLAARQASAFLAERGLLPFGSSGFLHREQPQGGGQAGNPSAPGPEREFGRTHDDRRSAAPSATGAEHVGEVVQQLAASAGGPAVAAGEIGEAAATLSGAEAPFGAGAEDRGAGIATDDASAEAVGAALGTRAEGGAGAPPGQVPAAGPSIGQYRPERDHPNPLVTRPADHSETRPVLQAALSQARNMPPPPLEAAHTAFRSLHPDLQGRMRQAYEEGGANGVRLEAARRSTSDLISNAQAADLMMVARASEHGMAHTLLGLEAAEPSPVTSPSPAANPSAASPGSAPAGTSSGREAPAPRRPSRTAEQSPLAADREAAWREAGPSAQPHID